MLRRDVVCRATVLVSLLTCGRAAAQAPGSAAGVHARHLDATAAAPVRIIEREEILASGKVRVGDVLQALPEQGNAINTQFNVGGDGSTRVALRGLGPERTLVLLNGRRFVTGGVGADASVDLDAIPSNAVERIEILTGGASAAYGSDAVAGVVNLVTRERLDGAEAAAYAGTSTETDGTTYDVSASAGTAGDRGSLLFVAGYTDQQPIWSGDRSWSATPLVYDYRTGQAVFTGSSATPAGLVELDPVTCTNAFCQQVFSENEALNGGPFAGGRRYEFARDPAFGTSGYRLATGDPLYNFLTDAYLVTPQRRVQLFAAGDVRAGDAVRAYLEAAYVNRHSRQVVAPEPLFADEDPLTVSANSLYNPFGHDLTFVGRRLTELGRRTSEQDVDTFHVVGGVDGTLGDPAGALSGWRWDVSAGFGRSQSVTTTAGALWIAPLQPALGPSMIDPASGQPICVRVAGDPATRIDGCVPLELLGGAGSITPAMIAPLAFTGTDRGHDQLASVQVSATGELFRLMADRPVAVAAGYEYRDVRGAFSPDPAVVAFQTTRQIALPAEGAYHASEVHAELSIPVVSGRPGARDLEATLAARYSAYSTFGGVTSWTGGLRWRVAPAVTLRGTYSSAFRAPSIGELYGGALLAKEGATDPCASPADPLVAQNCGAAAGNGDARASQQVLEGANPNLGPETARVLTVGVLVEPGAVRNLRVALDYHAIALRDAVASLGPDTILSRCYTAGQYCDRVHRRPDQLIDYIDGRDANARRTDTSGLDLSVRYALPTAIGRFDLAGDGTWLRTYDEVLPDGTVIHDQGTYALGTGAFPAYELAAGVRWAWKALGAGVSTRYVGSFEECAGPSGRSPGGLCQFEEARAAAAGRPPLKRDVGAWATTDLFVSWAVASRAGRTSFSVGARNVLDAAPPVVYATGGAFGMSDPTAYDYAGRFVWVRVAHAY